MLGPPIFFFSLHLKKPQQWFRIGSVGGQHLAVSGDAFDCPNWGEWGCCWHVLGGGLGCWHISYNAQDSYTWQRLIQPKCQQHCRLRNPVLATPAIALSESTTLRLLHIFAQWPFLSSASLSPTICLLMSNYPPRFSSRIPSLGYPDHAQGLMPPFSAFSHPKFQDTHVHTIYYDVKFWN